ncbi:DUF4194 domain-containing protein [Marinibaculum pumilum]|uniref:DUF4194 domain-containing protein n=1 Tax=Marinibaculum pumilum TaxID=1766165 RepID=A0ABV7KYT5_9PROT
MSILRELLELEAAGHDDRKLRRAAAALLDRQFLHAADRGAAQHYHLLVDDRYWRYFEGLFDAIGRRLVRNEGEQWVGLLPDMGLYPDLAGALPRMRQAETLLLLVAALVYQEKINVGEVEQGAVVRTDTGELFDRYATLLGRERMKDSEFRELLGEVRRRGIVAVGEADEESLDFEVFIRPMIKLVVSADVREALRQFAGEEERMLDKMASDAPPEAAPGAATDPEAP